MKQSINFAFLETVVGEFILEIDWLVEEAASDIFENMLIALLLETGTLQSFSTERNSCKYDLNKFLQCDSSYTNCASKFKGALQNDNLLLGSNITPDIYNFSYVKCSKRFWIDLINVCSKLLII